MSLDELPDWLPAWCRDHLGHPPAETLFALRQMSTVFGLRLADGAEVVVKARPDDGRAETCVTVQARLAERGLPCALPLTPAVGVGPLTVHAEEFRPGGEVLPGDSPEVAARYAQVYASLMAGLATVRVTPPLPNPRWVRWDHTDSETWPAIDFLDERDQRRVPDYLVDIVRRIRNRLLAAELPCVLGHADYEAQNLRWHGNDVWVVHDWDSLGWQPEAALVGIAGAVFPKLGPATLPPVASTEAFLDTYQQARGRSFTAVEQQIAWAASLWTAAHDLRWEALHEITPQPDNALLTQAAERLRLANA